MKAMIPETTSHADERRRSLILAAYHIIAEHGLNGLRTRAVAAQVGLTHATLHYYFPTKEALIKDVIDYAVFHRLLGGFPLRSEEREGTPVEQLRRLLTALQQNMQEDTTNVLVLYELVLRAQHDAAIRDLFLRENIFGNWFLNVRLMLEEGIAQGQLRADLDPSDTTSVLMTFILGLGITFLVPLPTSADQMFDQLIKMLTG